MAIAFIDSDKGAAHAGTTATTTAFDSTGATLLVIGATADNGTTTISTGDISDSKSNTWTGATNSARGALSAARIFYVNSDAPTVGSGHTASQVGTGTRYPALALAAFSGTAASPFDVENTNSTAGATSLSTGSVTPSGSGYVAIALLNIEGGSGFSIDSGFTIIETSLFLTPGEGLVLAYKILSDTSAVNPTFSWTGSAAASASIAVFKAAAGAAIPAHLLTLLGCGG